MHTAPLLSGAVSAALILAATAALLSSTNALAESRTLELASFTKANVSSGIDATFVVGETQSVVVDAGDPKDFEDLHIAVVDGRLEAWIDVEFWDVVTFHQHDIKLTVSVPNLETLGASMGAQVEATGMTGDVTIGVSSGAGLKVSDIVADAATINASTGGIMSLNGSCETAGVQTSTGALIVGGKFECTDLNIEASSGSTTLIFATGQVNANASSGAKVNLTGHPDHVDDETDSGGDVDVLN